jgi:hypothetical protein
MLAMARERATREGVTNLELRVMDATRLEGVPTSYFDATLIRWGLMFMDLPVAALRATLPLERAIRGPARLGALPRARPPWCWRPAAGNAGLPS